VIPTDDADLRLLEVETALFARAPETMIEPSLDRVREVLALLGDPQLTFPSIHVAGTNGKTSVARMTDALLGAFELRTGRYTSPHLESVTERIVVDAEPISAAAFVAAYDELAPSVALVESDGGRALTFFELLTLMAFVTFADAPVDAASVEVGLGGAWDATNVLAAPVAVVTPVGMDHMDYLGDTLEEIAGQKAGVMQADQIVVVAQQRPSAAQVLLEHAAQVGATPVREGLEFGVLERRVAVGGQLLAVQGLAGIYTDLFVPLHGAHQAHNAACAVVAVEAFIGGGEQLLDVEVVRSGLARADSPGRLEVVRRNPTVLLDAAHNPAGALSLAAALVEAFEFARIVGVVGVLADKDAEGILTALEPALDSVVVTRSSSPRAIHPDELAAVAVDVFGDERVSVEPVLARAIEVAVDDAETDVPLGAGGVVVTGSVTLAGEARSLLRG